MDSEQIADFRRTVRGHMAERPAISQSATTIWRALTREHGCSLRDVESACVALITLGAFVGNHDSMGGAVVYYRVTAQGLLDHEAGR